MEPIERPEPYACGSDLFGKPTLLVDWLSGDDKQAAKRSQSAGEERHISWSELFLDLVFVAAIARLGESLRGDDDDPDFLPAFDWVVKFGVVFSVWGQSTYYATRFFVDDLFHKLYLATLMIGVTLLAVHSKVTTQ